MSKLTTQEVTYLKEHFKTWIVTDKCYQTFDVILEKAISMRILEEDEEISLDWKKGSLFIEFQGTNWNDEAEPVWAIFAPTDETNTGLKDSITSLHEAILLFKPESDSERLNFPSFMYDHFTEYEDDSDIERYYDFCDLGQDCVVGDSENLNSFNKPKLCFFSHGDSLDDLDAYSGQDDISYNYGGFVLRVLAYIVYANSNTKTEEMYDEFSC